MIGVVVWSNSKSEKAVIWCEDQASLAYLGGTDSLLNPKIWPEPGDLLELESEMVGELRYARKVSMLSEQGCVHLPEMLRISGEMPSGNTRHLRLVSSHDDRKSLPSESREANDGLPEAVAVNAR